MSKNHDEAVRRLMDMLAGWQDYVYDGAGESFSTDLERYAVAELYQESGALSIECEHLCEIKVRRGIEDFVKCKVLPVLLDGGK